MTQHHYIKLKKYGEVVTKRTRVSNKGKICNGNTWRLCHNDALKFIDDIEPYLQIPYKINQIEKAKEKVKLGLNRRFDCKYCNKDFASPSGRRRHEKKII